MVPIRVGMVERHSAVIEGLRSYFGRGSVVRLFHVYATVGAVLSGEVVDVVLLAAGIDTIADDLRELSAAGLPLVLYVGDLTNDQRQEVERAAVTVVNTSSPLRDVEDALLHVLGRPPRHRDDRIPRLSEREREALVLYAGGLPAKSVARRMDVSLGTAREYISRVRAKYEAVGRPAQTKLLLARRAEHDGFLQPGADGSATDRLTAD